MNYFIEKEAPDECDPDCKEIVIDHTTSSKNAADKSKKKDKRMKRMIKGKMNKRRNLQRLQKIKTC